MQLARWYYYWRDDSGKMCNCITSLEFRECIFISEEKKDFYKWHSNSVLWETLMGHSEFVYLCLLSASQNGKSQHLWPVGHCSHAAKQNNWVKEKGQKWSSIEIKKYLLEPQIGTYLQSDFSLNKYKLELSYHGYVMEYFSDLKKIRHYSSDFVQSSLSCAYSLCW